MASRNFTFEEWKNLGQGERLEIDLGSNTSWFYQQDQARTEVIIHEDEIEKIKSDIDGLWLELGKSESVRLIKDFEANFNLQRKDRTKKEIVEVLKVEFEYITNKLKDPFHRKRQDRELLQQIDPFLDYLEEIEIREEREKTNPWESDEHFWHICRNEPKAIYGIIDNPNWNEQDHPIVRYKSYAVYRKYLLRKYQEYIGNRNTATDQYSVCREKLKSNLNDLLKVKPPLIKPNGSMASDVSKIAFMAWVDTLLGSDISIENKADILSKLIPGLKIGKSTASKRDGPTYKRYEKQFKELYKTSGK